MQKKSLKISCPMNFGVDHSLTTFTSEGALKQCDDALNAALNGTLSVSARSTDGVVLASLKSFPMLVEKHRVRKVFQICDTLGITYAGLQPDFRAIYDHAVALAEDYQYVYGRYPYADVFVANLSRVIQEQTQKSGLRPFGVLLLVAGHVERKASSGVEVVPVLYQMEPSGSFQECDVSAIGKDYKNANKYVQSRLEGLDDNVVSCIAALQEFAGYSLEPSDLDIGIFRAETKEFKIFNIEDIAEVFESLKSK